MKISAFIIVITIGLFFSKFALAADRDTIYLEINKISITDTILLKGLGKYIDSLKKIAPTNDSTKFRWYLRLDISRAYGFSDTIDTKYIVEYTRRPYNPDEPDVLCPTYYSFVKGIPILIVTDRYPDFSLSTKLVIKEESKNKLIDMLMPFLIPPETNFQTEDSKTGKIRVFKNYWPGIWMEKEYKLKLSIIKSKKGNYYTVIKKGY